MTAPISPERLAELREEHASFQPRLKAHAVSTTLLMGEVVEMADELASLRSRYAGMECCKGLAPVSECRCAGVGTTHQIVPVEPGMVLIPLDLTEPMYDEAVQVIADQQHASSLNPSLTKFSKLARIFGSCHRLLIKQGRAMLAASKGDSP